MTSPELKELLFNLTCLEVKALARYLGVKPKRDKGLMINQITEQYEVNAVLEKLGIPINTGPEDDALQIAKKNLSRAKRRFALAIMIIMLPTVTAFYYSYYITIPRRKAPKQKKITPRQSTNLVKFDKKLQRFTEDMFEYNRNEIVVPNHGEYYAKIARSSLRIGNYKGALKAYTMAIESEPRNSLYYKERGKLFHLLDRFNEGTIDLAKAIQLDSQQNLNQ